MPDPTPQAGDPLGQAPSGQQQSQQATQQQTAQTPATEQQDWTTLPEWAQKSLREARDDSAKHRVHAKDRDDLAAKLKQIEDAQLSEMEKAKKTAQEADERAKSIEQQLKDERVSLVIEREARKHNIVDPETATLLIKSKVEYDKDGKPSNVGDLLEQLVKDKPYLVGQPSAQTPGAGANTTNPSRGGGAQTQTFTRAQIADRAFYTANKAAIEQAMRDGRIKD